jgi:GrpB-like predicted nucleotidyltransferase (UPF0157 family)
MRIVELKKLDSWSKLFEKEAKLLSASLGDHFITLHHIGSTSIPGIFSKPVIDMIMEVYDVYKLDALNSKFKELGYEPRGEYGIPSRRYFPKGGDHRTHHIHAFNQGTDEVQRHLAFRDYLVAHPLRAKDYEQLKIQLAKQFRESPQQYTQQVKTISYKKLSRRP